MARSSRPRQPATGGIDDDVVDTDFDPDFDPDFDAVVEVGVFDVAPLDLAGRRAAGRDDRAPGVLLPGPVTTTGSALRALEARERAGAGVDGRVVELLLDAKELVVLRDALGASGGTGLDLAAVGRDREVGDG